MNNNFSLSHRGQEPENGVLYLVGTPIGNLLDISSRAINILTKVNLIACEDTRRTKKFLSALKISNKMISFNEHNSLKKIPKIIEKLNFGYSIALVSDAGLPGICDPGENLVKATRLNGLETICIPGACAALTALLASGLPSSKFIFEGFIPKKNSARKEALQRISSNQETTILYESPHRLKKLLLELKSFCGGDRKIHIARELTKKYEEHIGDDIDNLIKFFDEKKIMGEFTLIIEGINLSQNKEFDEIKLKKELHELIGAGLSLSSASKYLAKREKLSKNFIYNLN